MYIHTQFTLPQYVSQFNYLKDMGNFSQINYNLHGDHGRDHIEFLKRILLLKHPFCDQMELITLISTFQQIFFP